MMSRTCPTLMVGFSASSQPASAPTNGAAMDVPLSDRYPPPGTVLTMLTPGADTSPPTLENPALALLMSTASTMRIDLALPLVQWDPAHPKACSFRVSILVNVNPVGQARAGLTIGDLVLVALSQILLLSLALAMVS